jgi:hypothetical protein
VSQNKIGDVLRSQGDLSGALEAYREGETVSRRLAEADPTNASWQRDLSITYSRIALAYEQQDPSSALPAAEAGLLISERLSALDPTNATWQNDVAWFRQLVARLK